MALLLALPLGAKRLRVAFVGDPQVDNEKELGYARRSIYKELRERKDLDLAIFLGDLVNDDVAFLAPSRATLDSLPCPWACVPGNHDRDVYRVKGQARDMATYTRVIHAPDTCFERAGVSFIMMNDVRLVGTGGYEGGFREDQKAWLRKQLESIPADRLAVLCAHIPFNEFKAKDSLETILSIHPKMLLMCGHTHTMARSKLVFPSGLALEEVLAGAACGSWWRGRPDSHGIPSATQNCGAPRCYYVVDFKDGDYRLDYKVIGEPASVKASATLMDSTRLVLNVYGGAVFGEVQVKLPGRRGWISIPRHKEVAPEVLETYQFNKTLEKRSRNPLFIPMLRQKSPHIWSLDFADDPAALSALRSTASIAAHGASPAAPGASPAAPGASAAAPVASSTRARPIRIRYRDPSMRFSCRCVVRTW
jgi:predicted phosphodiesterase